ncbi:MAG: hypothetical protein AAF921_01715 [Cyanobacteria bacterium P01_D01_bin.44]
MEITSDIVPVAEIPEPSAELLKSRAGQEFPQYTSTETYARQILGASQFELYYLYAVGLAGNPPFPWIVSPGQSPYIVNLNETMQVGLIVRFDRSPLSRLLMCLGTKVTAKFHFEGFGGAAAERDIAVSITTVKDQFVYWIRTNTTPAAVGVNPGFYQLAATVEVGPSTRIDCGKYIYGYGYIGEWRNQFYEGPLP